MALPRVSAETYQQAGIVLLVVAVICAWFGIDKLVRSHASGNWPTVAGRVIAADMWYDPESGLAHRVDDIAPRFGSNMTTRYEARVRYGYSAEGAYYESDQRNWFSGSGDSWESQHAILRRYPKGKTVPVSYDPADPSFGLLEPGTAWASLPLALFGLALSAAGAWMAFGGAEAWIRKSEQVQEPAAYRPPAEFWPDAPLK